VHKKLYPGIRESQARAMMTFALGAAGLKDGGCLTLFGGVFLYCFRYVDDYPYESDSYLTSDPGPIYLSRFLFKVLPLGSFQ